MTIQLQARAELLLREREAGGELSQYEAFKHEYWDTPAGFVRDCIEWGRVPVHDGPTPYQEEALGRLPAEKRVSLRGPHGLGKTAISAWAVLWFSLTRDGEDWKALTTASAWRQLTKFLWPEISKWVSYLDWKKIGRRRFDERTELLTRSIKLDTGEAFALASNKPATIEGAHARYLLYIFDEAKTIPPGTWDAAEGAFAHGEPLWLSVSTPGEPNGRFYQIHKRESGYEDWWVRHVAKEEAIEAGMINKQWVVDRKRQWGERSAVYQNRVEGQFASSDEDGVISLSLVEQANQNWHEWKRPDKLKAVGVDVGRGGDKSVYARRYGNYVADLERSNERDVMPVAGKTLSIIRDGGDAIVDVIGVGAGVFDRLREMKKKYKGRAYPFNAGESTDRLDRSGELGFADKRSAAWWNLRELLQNGEVALPPDDKLTGDLTAPKWRVMSGGKIKVESKAKIKKRLGRSTDDGDAVVQAFWTPPARDFIDGQPEQQSKWSEHDVDTGSRWKRY